MARGGARFSADEPALVLSHYDVGVIERTEPVTAGNRSAPKMAIISERGKFLLKRRRRGKDDLYRVSFSHAVQMHLEEKGFPVTKLVRTREDESTILQLDHHIYELFEFVSGCRYDGTKEETIDAGRQMAKFHACLRDFGYELLKPLQGGFHDSATVRRHLRTIGAGKKKNGLGMVETGDELTKLYNTSSVQVNELGFDSWRTQIIHGDWHPGNMLFSQGKIAAVLDFDSVKAAPIVTDLANGMLQFSLVGGRPNPKDWPDYLDEAKLVQFLTGYRQAAKLERGKVYSLIDLMIETMIAEAILPVATTGFFGSLSGEDFLQMICRKARWIYKHRDKLVRAITAKP